MEKCSITKIYIATLISLLLFPVFTSYTFASANPLHITGDSAVYVDPPVYRASQLGETFNISISIAGVTAASRLIGAEFKLRYNATLIETRESSVREGDFFKAFGETYFQAYFRTDDQGVQFIHAFVILLPSQDGNYSIFPQGAGALATVTFTAMQHTQLAISSELELFDVILVDSDLNTTTPQTSNGLFEMTPLALPTLEVLPVKSITLRNGESFEVKVNMKDLDKDWHLTGLQFKLRYNTSLVETKPEWIVEGDFLKSFGTTFFQAIVENDYGLVGIIVLPDQNGSWNGTFAQGNGVIATLTFRTLYQPVEPLGSTIGMLELFDTILVNDETKEIPHTVVNGEFEIISAFSGVDQYRPVDVQVDVGTLHFNGEIADFYILVTDFGQAVDADEVKTDLYHAGANYLDLTASVEHVAKGLYRVPYTIPISASSGTYVLLVQVKYATVSGSAIKSFDVSSTLSAWNTYISNINDNIATIVVPNIGQIKADLTTINATLLGINDRVATITTVLGSLTTDVASLKATLTRVDGEVVTVQTTLGTLQGKIESVQGDTATVKTDVGTVKAKVSDLPANMQTSINLLYVAIVLVLIAAIAAILVLIYSRKKQQ